MKIGIFDPYLDDLGGGEKYMMSIAECLSDKHEVFIFWDKKQDLRELKSRFSLNLSRVGLKQNIFSEKVNLWKKLLETRNYDAIIFLSDGSIPFSLSKRLFIHLQQPLLRINSAGWKDAMKLKRITKVFYNSEYTKSFNDKRLLRVPNVVIYPPVKLLAKNIIKDNMVLHVGRFRVKNVGIEDYKKQGTMIEAFKEMVDEGLRDWKFVIAASVKKEDEEKFSQLKSSARGYPIQFLINNTNDELWEVYNKAKIYWHASGFGENLQKHPEFAEHFGISTVEAMGAGAVPVVINVGGQKEIITDEKNGFFWDTISELKVKTKKLIDNKELLNDMAKQARMRAKDFSKAKFCQQIMQLIEQ